MGTLSIVATPIGNLEDITLRALRTLKEADAIFAEDTRVISKLLARYEIKKPLYRLDASKEDKRAQEIIERLGSDEKIVFVTDAGTPGISDPGTRLVAAVRKAGFQPVTIPGPSALTAALSIAGVDATEFVFLGFLPHKKGRQTALKGIAVEERAIVLYESPHRILKLLLELEEVIGDRMLVIARELTKIHEEVLSGTAAELRARLESAGSARGEFVVIVHPK
ncbi:16S rRNA (cytidine(1402)-2'-O)-methyltransferase [Candidatus Kaiserbacteria bacterium RIFCSPHIGHO2_01_FULL_56_24]|uniref:Ribosomal RNA small subunit methyltransferase I n=1 Tax=Candidatus Kaiserbacteria bacterium RIFCSPHIGHO2_01_FULL_56_24 TaxID=1798487 RepID=A0A1F6DBP5_9BACT|nr:MAG: 16S rRNA (cytidine(1402)-2'-O)-methyltransferase [Candidatus Kaiserbacteria bacterium RIFCSPHIGHO2_01_FULL_56_24]